MMGEESHNARQKDTQCCPVEPVPKLPNFLTQVLYAVEHLQRKRKGVCMADIVKYMKDKFHITGDVRSRVETSVAKAHSHGFLYKDNDNFTTLPPAARLQRAISEEMREGIVKELQQVFIVPPSRRKSSKRAWTSKVVKKPCEGIDKDLTTATQTKTSVTKENIKTLLRLLEEILMEEVSDTEENGPEKSSGKRCCEENYCSGDCNPKDIKKRPSKKRKKERSPLSKKCRKQ